MNRPSSKAKRGRPAWQPDLKEAERLASLGLNMIQIANSLGISQSTLYEKLTKYPEFSEALKRGHAKGVAKVAEKFMKKVEQMDTTAMIFWLKCNAGWREYSTHELEKVDLSNFILL
jgi:hypothetical protein